MMERGIEGLSGALTTRVYREPLCQNHEHVEKGNNCFRLLKELIDTYGERATMGSILDSLAYKE